MAGTRTGDVETHLRGVGVGDVGQLYCSLAKPLEQVVRHDVRAHDALIQDACQFAWSRLLYHQHRVCRETVFPWLARTAVREALRLLRRGGRDVSLDAAIEDDADAVMHLKTPSLDELFEQRERVAMTRLLPDRQGRLLWLHALGLSYAEIAAQEGCTMRTVERQVLRARRRARKATG